MNCLIAKKTSIGLLLVSLSSALVYLMGLYNFGEYSRVDSYIMYCFVNSQRFGESRNCTLQLKVFNVNIWPLAEKYTNFERIIVNFSWLRNKKIMILVCTINPRPELVNKKGFIRSL